MPKMVSPPNIVWITMESTRADHTTLGGYSRRTTPNLQRIADRSRGRAFDECVSHGIWTLSSSASILTGTWPSHHGAGMDADSIPAGLPTVSELLGDVGYYTACLSPNSHISSATGLDRGFDRFSWISKSSLLSEVGVRTLLKFAANCRRHGGGLTLDTRKHGAGFLVNDLAKRWLSSFEGEREPFFLYAHYGNPHHPYYPPRRYRDEYADGGDLSLSDAGETSLRHHKHLHELIADGCPLSASELEALTDFYDGEIAHADALIGDLFDHLQALDLDDTVFVVTADHGELFGERGLLAHMLVTHDAVSRVPLVVHGFDPLVDHGGETVQHADVMRTLLEATGADTSSLQGVDLTRESREYSVVQRGTRRCRKNLDAFCAINGDFDRERFPEGTLHAIRTSNYKYERSPDGEQLYSLPDERTDVSAARPEVTGRLRETLNEFLQNEGESFAPEREDGSAEFTDAMKEQLSDLGYLVD